MLFLSETMGYFSFTTLPPKKPEKDAETLAKERERRELLEKRKESLGKIMGKALMAVLSEKKSRDNLEGSQKELDPKRGVQVTGDEGVKQDRELREKGRVVKKRGGEMLKGMANLLLNQRIKKMKKERKEKCKTSLSTIRSININIIPIYFSTNR